MYLAHGPISFLSNEWIQKKKISNMKISERFIIGILSIFFGILPDFDRFALSMIDIPASNHHLIFTHSPIFYIGIWVFLRLVFVLISRFFNNRMEKFLCKDFVDVILNTFLISTLVHLLMDMIASGIMVIYPISSQTFSLFEPLFNENYFTSFFLSKLFGVEVIFCAIFFVYIFNLFFKKNILGKILKTAALVLAPVFFAFTVYISVNTYSNDYMSNYDQDYDSVEDVIDTDVDNDSIDNLTDVNKSDLAREAKNIIDSGKWASSLRDYRYFLGAFDSYRIISQAYFNLHSPIEYVLKDWYIKTNNIQEYSVEYIPLDVLYDYFEEKNLLKITNLEIQQPGTIMFITDKENNVIGAGIWLEDGTFATVLQSDTKLQSHSLDDLKSVFKEDIFKATR